MTQYLCEISLCSIGSQSDKLNVLFMLMFDGLNFSNWNEQVLFHLGVMDIDLAILKEKLVVINDYSSNEQKAYYKALGKNKQTQLNVHNDDCLK